MVDRSCMKWNKDTFEGLNSYNDIKILNYLVLVMMYLYSLFVLITVVENVKIEYIVFFINGQ